VLLFVGLMSYFPNSDAVNYFIDRVFPLITNRIPRARLLVVGANPPRRMRLRAAPQVTIVGRVPSVEPYFRLASAFVVPMRCGGGTRVKVLEAMLHGVPIVSTSLGCEGLAVRDGESVLLADTPETFAASVMRVCNDPALARRLAAGGSALVRAEYDWRQIGESVDGLLSHAAFA
jgi:glycosyltransferase involved in cell wall biosynthesis